jgi:hypothetical protein
MIIVCPHCDEEILIEEINCGIFRHGVFKDSLEQVNPHESKEILDTYINENKIYGCGKPFCIKDNIVSVCEYI